MLKVSRFWLALLAALGMSSAIAQTGPAVGGFNTTTSGNTTSHTYKAEGASDFARLMRGGYDPATNQSGFQALLQKKGYTPKGSEYNYQVTKSVPKAGIAKAIAKTLPVVGNLYAMAELLEALFDNPTYDYTSGTWQAGITQSASGTWYTYAQAGGLPSRGAATKEAACSASSADYTGSNAPILSNYVQDGLCNYCAWNGCGSTGFYLHCPDGSQLPYYATACPSTFAREEITEQKLEDALKALPTMPAQVDPLLQHIPPAALDDLAQDIEGTPGAPRAVPTSPSGTQFPDGWEVPESISSRQTNDALNRPQEITTTTKTLVRTLPTGQLQHDTTTTTTTTTTTGTNPDGSPITETTTSTETSTTTPAPPPDPTTAPPAPPEDLECGLPGTPPCKIDESGTPPPGDANFDAAEAEIETFKSGLYEALQAKLDEIQHEWSWTFQLPTGCAALQFDTRVGPVVDIDMCEFQPMIHDIMAMLWAAAGVFGALMIFLRANG